MVRAGDHSVVKISQQILPVFGHTKGCQGIFLNTTFGGLKGTENP